MTTTALTRTSLTRWALVFLAIPALVAGILAMHFVTGLTTLEDQRGVTDVATAAESQALVAAVDPTGQGATSIVQGCSTTCDPTDAITAIACLMLAILVTFVLRIRPGGTPGRLSSQGRIARIIASLGALPRPLPPSLIAFSISRV